ncbi:LLM class flavin-dependent oxidoreductase [Capillimicrobium parvum]|uniref:F420-dependent glucose-6-phosphate dehydrogenase n=1 Tax=Capillimicrobium parvum TaxID=2884022 RepID=A0A9E6Y3C4_9ACTN|nr:LLM class flavin-dependent oxidoreductase [Capillimicrobium parvum]UGS39125.1 F420-dependent glucose-6-phosphate dehydrogenase [Capillimicrobium parvum]
MEGTGARIQLGLFVSGQHPPQRNPAEAIREHLEQVELARELGFASVFAGQHFLSDPFAMFQSIPLLARLAASADGMIVGTGIVLLPLLNPVEVAENAATLHAICGGRHVLGVGIGYRAAENAAFGLGPGRAAVLEAKLDVVRRLLAGESVTASGPGYALEGARLALVPERPPPIWMAANGDRAVARAARLSDAWMVNPHTRLDELARQMQIFRAERAAAGLPPSACTPVIKEVCVAETDAAAMEAARPWLKGKYDAYVDWGQSEVLPPADTLRREFDELTAGGRFVLGSPETCTAILAQHVDRLGADHVICRVQWPGMPQEHVLRSLRLLAREVLPALRGNAAGGGRP